VNRKNLLLIFALALVVVRWLLVPFWEWKAEELSRLEAKRAQLAKAQTLVGSESQYDQIREHYQALTEALVPRLYVSEGATKLEVQKRVEVLLKQFDVDMQTVAWRDQGESEVLELVVGLSAPLPQIVAWQMAIARDDKWIDIPDWRLRRAGRLTGDSARYIGEVVLRITTVPKRPDTPEGLVDVPL
jgi:hypothetical protein